MRTILALFIAISFIASDRVFADMNPGEGSPPDFDKIYESGVSSEPTGEIVPVVYEESHDVKPLPASYHVSEDGLVGSFDSGFASGEAVKANAAILKSREAIQNPNSTNEDLNEIPLIGGFDSGFSGGASGAANEAIRRANERIKEAKGKRK